MREEVTVENRSALSAEYAAGPERPAKPSSPAQAFWNHREWLRDQGGFILDLSAAIGCPSNFTPYQWAQIAAFTREFRPDLILELGRRFGNSTACFIQAANSLGNQKCQILSLCLSDDWQRATFPKLQTLIPAKWFAAADIRQSNILTCDIARGLKQAQRILVFWDAHGFHVAEWVLGELLPKIVAKPHVVIMHDLSDTRYVETSRSYGEAGLWKGMNDSEAGMFIGHIYSRVGQAISISDFATRNNLPLHSADESFHQELAGDAEKCEVLRRDLGEELFQTQCHWFWFSLSGRDEEVTFPKFAAPAGPVALARDCEELRAELEGIYNSAGWKLLNRWRTLSNGLAPAGSVRREVYNFVKAALFRQSR